MGLAWLTPVAQLLADQELRTPSNRPKSIIALWLNGGPSQLETFDPHPQHRIAGGTTSIDTRAQGIQLAHTLPRLAQQMDSVAIIRNVVSHEGDHERAQYNVKTGFRPDPTLVHPAIGAVLCHELPRGKAEIPRHISILPSSNYGRGGYLGDKFDAFQIGDPRDDLPDINPRVSQERFDQRLKDVAVVDRAFARGRLRDLEREKTLHQITIQRAVTMMSSEQLAAFNVAEEPQSVRDEFGNTPFGRGCLAAMRLVEQGVRCIEVSLGGWDTHVNNHSLQASLAEILDPAFASLIIHLKDRDLWKETIVLCGGEFGRTPKMNPAEGRDHWPHGFSIAVAGGPIRGGFALGETDPQGNKIPFDQGTPIPNVHATLLQAVGIEPTKELDTPVGRPIKLSEGHVIKQLLS